MWCVTCAPVGAYSVYLIGNVCIVWVSLSRTRARLLSVVHPNLLQYGYSLAPPVRFDLRDGREQLATRLLLGVIARRISRCISLFSLVLRVLFLCFAAVVFARAEAKGGKAGSKNVSCFVGFVFFRLRLKLVTETYFSRDVAMSAVIIASKLGGEQAKRSEKFATSSSFVLIPSGRERRQAASSPFQSIVSGF